MHMSKFKEAVDDRIYLGGIDAQWHSDSYTVLRGMWERLDDIIFGPVQLHTQDNLYRLYDIYDP